MTVDKRQMHARRCRQCGEVLRLARQRLYCSNACKFAGQVTRLSTECRACGAPLEVERNQAARGRGIYCSIQCKARGTQTLARPLTRTCDQCGSPFRTGGRQATARFCSQACYGLSQRKQPNILTCVQCGTEKEFAPGARMGRFCSQRCWNQFRRKRVQRQCVRCGREFECHPSDIVYAGARYCGRQCQSERTGGHIEKRCEACQTVFRGPPSRVRNKRFCTPVCYRNSRGTVQRECVRCSRRFSVYKAESTRGFGKYCRRRCYDLARRPPTRRCTLRGCCGEFQNRPWRGQRFCSMRCAYKGRVRKRSVEAQMRLSVLLELHRRGFKGKSLQEELARRRPDWWMGKDAIRQAIWRESHPRKRGIRPLRPHAIS